MAESPSLEPLRAERVVAVVRAPSPEGALAAVDALLAGGLRALEVTYSTPAAGRVIAEVARRHSPRVVIGAGTVLRASEVGDAVGAGARFIVSPGIEPSRSSRAVG